MLYTDLLKFIHFILGQNGETRILRLLNMTNRANQNIKCYEPFICEREVIETDKDYFLRIVAQPGSQLDVKWGDGRINKIIGDNFSMNGWGNEPIYDYISYIFSNRYRKPGTYRVKIYDKTKGCQMVYDGVGFTPFKKVITEGDIGV